jgi:hypothetical protein
LRVAVGQAGRTEQVEAVQQMPRARRFITGTYKKLLGLCLGVCMVGYSASKIVKASTRFAGFVHKGIVRVSNVLYKVVSSIINKIQMPFRSVYNVSKGAAM